RDQNFVVGSDPSMMSNQYEVERLHLLVIGLLGIHGCELLVQRRGTHRESANCRPLEPLRELGWQSVDLAQNSFPERLNPKSRLAPIHGWLIGIVKDGVALGFVWIHEVSKATLRAFA